MAQTSITTSDPGVLNNTNPPAGGAFTAGGFAFIQDDTLGVATNPWGITSIPDTYDTLYYTMALRTTEVALGTTALMRANGLSSSTLYSSSRWAGATLTGNTSGSSYMASIELPGASQQFWFWATISQMVGNYGQNITAENPAYVGYGTTVDTSDNVGTLLMTGMFESTSTAINALEWVPFGGSIASGAWYRLYGLKK